MVIPSGYHLVARTTRVGGALQVAGTLNRSAVASISLPIAGANSA